MTKKDKILVQNYAAFIPNENDSKVYSVVLNDSDEEIGIEVRGILTTFGLENQNGQKWDKASYDKCIAEYFDANELNIPIDLMHVRDIQHLAGVARKFTKRSNGIEITAFIPKNVYFYNLIKVLLDNGVLQGFSNYGYVSDWDYDRENDVMIVKEFFLISASLVDIPADTGAKLIQNKTDFEGFPASNAKEEKDSLQIFGL